MNPVPRRTAQRLLDKLNEARQDAADATLHPIVQRLFDTISRAQARSLMRFGISREQVDVYTARWREHCPPLFQQFQERVLQGDRDAIATLWPGLGSVETPVILGYARVPWEQAATWHQQHWVDCTVPPICDAMEQLNPTRYGRHAIRPEPANIHDAPNDGPRPTVTSGHAS